MISIEILIAQNAGLDRWILNDWVRPEQRSGAFVFQEIDVARVRLIRDLRQDLDIDEQALPVVLSLVDQLYELRRRFHALGDAIAETAPDDLRRQLAALLALRAGGGSHEHAAGPGALAWREPEESPSLPRTRPPP